MKETQRSITSKPEQAENTSELMSSLKARVGVLISLGLVCSAVAYLNYYNITSTLPTTDVLGATPTTAFSTQEPQPTEEANNVEDTINKRLKFTHHPVEQNKKELLELLTNNSIFLFGVDRSGYGLKGIIDTRENSFYYHDGPGSIESPNTQLTDPIQGIKVSDVGGLGIIIATQDKNGKPFFFRTRRPQSTLNLKTEEDKYILDPTDPKKSIQKIVTAIFEMDQLMQGPDGLGGAQIVPK